MSDPEPYECDYCGNDCEQLFHIVDDNPGDMWNPPSMDQMDVCAECRKELTGGPR